MQIDCGLCLLRRYVLTDKESIVRYASNPKVAQQLRDRFPHPYTEADADRFLEKALSATTEALLAIDVEGEAVGGIGLTRGADVERFNAEVGYWIGEPFWGRGLATAALRGITNYGFEELQLHRIIGMVFSSNPVSRRILQKVGYRHEGTLRQHVFKNGVFLDQEVYAILAAEWQDLLLPFNERKGG